MNNIQSKENIENSITQMEFIKNVFTKRLLTLLMMTLSISFILAVLIQMVFYIRYEAIILLGAALIFFVLNSVRFSRWFYLSLKGSVLYYKTTIIIHFVFAMINFLCYLFIPNMIYSWIFLLAKFLKFIIPGYSDILSMLVFHGVLLLTALVSTFSVKWIVIEEKTAPKIEMLNTNDEEVKEKD